MNLIDFLITVFVDYSCVVLLNVSCIVNKNGNGYGFKLSQDLSFSLRIINDVKPVKRHLFYNYNRI